MYDLVTSKKQSLAEAARRSLGSIVSKVVETIPPVAALKAATSGGSKESAEALAKFQATPFAQKAGTA
ncbi:MAG: hypothetical protein H5T71_00155, partial [Chloroflexi bacterium]|nr:hypothetical protein [Chloroflexota bacterium]